MSLEIKPFDDQKNVKDNSIIKIPMSAYIVGGKGLGKTSLLLNMLTNPLLLKGKFNQLIFFSPTSRLDEKIQRVLNANPNILVKNEKLLKLIKKLKERDILDNGMNKDIEYYEKDLEIQYQESIQTDFINEIINRNKYITEEFGKQFSDKILMIFDDSIEGKIFKKEIFKKLVFKSRHYNISIIITSQSYFQLPKPIRLNMSYLILFETANKKELESIYNENANTLTNKQFYKLVEDVFEIPYNFLWVNYFKSKKERFWEQFKRIINLSDYIK